jgi:DNA-binding LacI/PurR family transcriptional regulator
MKPTIKDVAKQAGVGIGTVSRVLNSSAQVNPETRQRVLDAMKAIGYKPSQSARQLPRRTTLHNIGVITQPFQHYYSFVERLRGVQQALREARTDYELVLYNVSSPRSYDERLALISRNGLVEALLVIDLGISPEAQRALEHSSIPFICLNPTQNTAAYPSIPIDNVEGGYLAARHLLALGHRRIAYVGDHFDDSFGFRTSIDRFHGLRRALLEAEVPLHEPYYRKGPHGYEAARTLAVELAQLPEPPTAIFAMSDIQALGVIDALHGLGLRVPEDISVIGFDDVELAMHAGLTTVRQHLERSGYEAAHFLLGELAGGAADAPMLPPLEVITRRTTRPHSAPGG